MKKSFLSLLLCSSLSFAGIVNGVALTVNEDPITLYDIDKTMVENNLGKNEAVNLLIDKILYEQMVKTQNITADLFDINDYTEKLAAQNGMDVFTFKSIVKQKYSDYSVFENEAKDVIVRQKLIQKIVKGQLAVANEEDLKIYYENNKNKFTTAQSYQIVQYSSKSKTALINFMRNPLSIPQDVEKENLVLKTGNLEAQTQYILNETPANSFTPIFIANRKFTAIFVVSKDGETSLDFDSVKGKIFNDIMTSREKKYLKDYFEKQRLTADIKIVR